jgi:replication factor C subunit 3/5
MAQNIWIEKYRPKDLDNLVGQDKIVELLKNMTDNKFLPNLLFYGKSGTGKTSLIQGIINKFYGNNQALMVMKLDASDDRGINTVRDEIKCFAEKISIFQNKIKLIILDEADSMTFDAQSALKRIIEKYSSCTRFCFICNYENKIINEIKSRCISLKFNIIDNSSIHNRIKYISKKENIKITKSTIGILTNLAEGDLRKSINMLQSISYNKINIKKEDCFKIFGIPSFKEIDYFCNILLDKKYSFDFVYKILKQNIIDTGYSASIFIKYITNNLIEKKLDNIEDHKICHYIIKLSELEYSVTKSTFGDIYLIGIVALFKKN